MSQPHRLLCLGLLTSLVACSSPGQLVLGIGTDMPAKDQIDQVKLHVTNRSGSVPPLDVEWLLSGVPALDFRLPGSFNLYADQGAAPTFDVTIQGWWHGGQIVERRAALGIQEDQDLFIRLALVARCEQIGCPKSLTCIEGLCKPQYVDIRTLPAYRADLVERIECASGTTFIDTSTHLALPTGSSCASGSLCSEGTCLVDPLTLPDVDSRPLVGGAAELFSTNSPGFFPVGAIDAARFHASASVLGDGRVLVVGGFPNANIDGKADGGPAPVDGAIVYDPTSAAFVRIADPPVALGGHTATVLADGKVLLVGASAPNTPAAMLFDPSTDTFTKLAAPRTARYFHTATLLGDGTVLFVGGAQQNAAPFATAGGAEIFDPSTQSFRLTKVGPVLSRVFHTATLMPDGRVLITGGLDGSSGSPTATTEIYIPGAMDDRFLSDQPLGQARALHTASLLSDGSVLIVGGEAEAAPGAALETTERFVRGGTMRPPQPPDAPFGRAGHLAIALGKDRVLFLAGTTSLQSPTLAPAGGAFVYDNGTFTMLPEPAVARIKAFGVVLKDGDVLIGGGTVGGALPTDGGVSSDAGPPAAIRRSPPAIRWASASSIPCAWRARRAASSITRACTDPACS